MSRRWLLYPSFVTALLVACGGGPTESKLPRTASPRGSASGKPRLAGGFPPMSAHRFAQVSDVIGPYVGRDGEVALAAWAETSANGRTLFATRIDGQGRPGEPARIASLPSSLDLMLVRGFGGASSAGQARFAVVTTHRSEQKTSIAVTALTAEAAAVWGPSTLVERTSRVLWLGFVVAGADSLLLWAEQATSAKAGDPASIYGTSLSTDGKLGQPTVINAKACVWQVASLGSRAALASVKPGPNGCGSGSVTLDLLGAGAKPEKSLELGGQAGLDLDLTAAPDAFVLAWSDRGHIEPRVVTAVVDGTGVVRAPAAPALVALGEQAVVALAGGASSGPAAFLVWENVAERSEGARAFELSALDASGRASGAHSRLLYGRADGGTPELASYGDGLAALTLAPACRDDDDCDGSAVVPTFVAFDAELRVKTSEPLILDALGGRAADLGWGLSCGKEGCFALAALSRSPAALCSVSLPLRPNPYRSAAEADAPATKPRVVSSEALLRASAPLSKLAIGDLSGRSLVGYVTDFDPTTPWQKLTRPAEDGRLEPLRARVSVRAFATDNTAAPLGDVQSISLRAHSMGGLSLVGDATGKEGLAIWAGLDKGEPQVFLTALAADGKRGQQRMLTRKLGERGDVAGLAVDGGYLVGWVDERSGDAEVYATRVARSLEKASPEQRITLSDGAASQLVLTRVAGKPYALWADARAAEEPGWADIYGAFLRPGDAARDGAEHRISSTRPHSFSPETGQLGATPIVAWLEEAMDAEPASVRIAALSPSGDVTGNVSSVPIVAGAPRGLGIACGDVSCRVAVTVEVEGRGELQGFEWRPSTESRVSRLSALNGPAAVAVSPQVRGNFVYVADLRDGQGLVRRLGVDW